MKALTLNHQRLHVQDLCPVQLLIMSSDEGMHAYHVSRGMLSCLETLFEFT